MLVKIFQTNSFVENTYLVYDPTGECIVIDAGFDTAEAFAKLKRFVTDNGLRPQMVVNTHGHIDHILGAKFVTDMWNIPFYLHSADMEFILSGARQAEAFGMPFFNEPVARCLENTNCITFGETRLKILCTPGHSKGGICLYCEEDGVLFSGDTLFAGTIGRSDLPGGDYDTLMDSIHGKLLVLPPETKVYPGHGPSTTIGDELAQNPFLHRLNNNDNDFQI